MSRISPRWLTGSRATALCLIAYCVLALLLFAPVNPLSTTQLPTAGAGNPAGSDAYQMTWFLRYVPYAIAHGQNLFHTDLIDYPSGVNLADNTTVPVLGLLGSPITLTLGPVAAFNFLIRLAFAVSGVSMFFVLGRWCSSYGARFVGGLVYGFGPYMAGQALHLDLVFVPIPPLLVLLGDELVRRRRMRAPVLGLAIGSAAAVQYLISPDVLSGCVVMALIAGAGLAIRHRALVRERLAYVAGALAVAGGVFLAVAGYPIYELLTGPGHLTGPVLAVSNLQGDSADLLGPLVPTSTQLLTPPFISRLGDYFVGGNLSENGSYLGIPLLAVLVVIVRRLRRDATVMFFAAMAVAAWVLSLGGHLVIGTWRSPIPLPGDISAHLPLLQDTIPARYALYVMLFVSMIVAIGIERVWLHNPVPRATAGAGAGAGAGAACAGPSPRKIALVSAIVVLTLLPDAPFVNAGLAWSPSLPKVIEDLVPSGGVVATFPPTELGHVGPMAWQALDDMSFRLVGGYANIAVPGQAYGTKGLEPPKYLSQMPEPPTTGPAGPPPQLLRARLAVVDHEEAELRAYLDRRSVAALVFTGAAVPADGEGTIGYGTTSVLPPASYWFLTAALGPPRVVGPGYVIWLAGKGGWRPSAAA